jgi:tetratricopeptide (TPR) repeat protein
MRQWRFHYWVKLVALIFILSCSYVNYVYAQAWQSDLKLWNYAVIQSPGSAPVWNNLAIARMNAGDAIGALMAIETGLSFEWGRYEFIINRGYLKLVLARGRQDILMEAKADLVLAESKLPNNATAKYYLGLCEFQLGQLTESLTHFQEALSLAKSIFFEAEINFQKGEVYAKLGERVLACQSWTLASTHHQVARERLNDCQVK